MAQVGFGSYRVCGISIALLIFSVASDAATGTYDSAALNGATFLANAQNVQDGSWGVTDNLKPLYTAEAVTALRAYNQRTRAYYAGITWLENHRTPNVDYTSRRVMALAPAGDDLSADAAYLVQAQSLAVPGNNGWGVSTGYQGSTLDTSLTLQALSVLNTAADAAKATTYLQSIQLTGTDKGWPLVQEVVSDPAATAQAIIALAPRLGVANVAITNGISSLRTNVSTSSPLAVQAVAALAYLTVNSGSTDATPLLNNLLATQGVDGSIAGDPYLTALAIKSFAMSSGKGLASLRDIVAVRDQKLRSAINLALGKNALDNLNKGELAGLTSLDISGQGIKDLTGLEWAVNLTSLNASNNQIASAAPLSGLTKLTQTNLTGNPINGGVLDASKVTTTLYVSGSTSQTPTLAQTMVNFCDTTVNTYTDDLDGLSGLVYYCARVNASSGLTAGTSLMVVKSESGSLNGVKPLANQTTLPFPNPASCNNGATAPVGYNTSNVAGSLVGTCAFKNNTSVAVVPQVGLSDIPSEIWGYLNQFTAPTTVNYVTKTLYAGQGFGVAVSDALYLALQREQIQAGSIDASCAGDFSAGSCQPAIAKDHYAAILSYGTQPLKMGWSRLMPLTSASAAATDPVKKNPVNLCMRSVGSGTEAAAEAYFLNLPCNMYGSFGNLAQANPAIQYDANGGDPKVTGLPIVFSSTIATSTGGVKSCLTANPIAYSLGVMSLQNDAPTTGWKWIKVKGVSPNLDPYNKATTVSGVYDFAYEMQLIYTNATGTPPAVAQFSNNLTTYWGNGYNLSNMRGVYADPNSGAASFIGQTHAGSRGNNMCQVHLLNPN